MLVVNVRAVKDAHLLLFDLQIEDGLQVFARLLALHLNLTIGLHCQISGQLVHQKVVVRLHWRLPIEFHQQVVIAHELLLFSSVNERSLKHIGMISALLPQRCVILVLFSELCQELPVLES